MLDVDKVHGVTTEEVSLNGDSSSIVSLDGISIILSNNDVVQVSHQTNLEENGLYRVKLTDNWELLHSAEKLAKSLVICNPGVS